MLSRSGGYVDLYFADGESPYLRHTYRSSTLHIDAARFISRVACQGISHVGSCRIVDAEPVPGPVPAWRVVTLREPGDSHKALWPALVIRPPGEKARLVPEDQFVAIVVAALGATL
jgi:hypothetical protein